MKKLRFKNRNGVLYFGLGDKLKSSRMKYNAINKNILIGKFNKGLLDEYLGIGESYSPTVESLLNEVMVEKRNSLKHNSILVYDNIAKKNIIPYFIDKTVMQVEPITIKRWHDALMEKGLKRQTITIARTLLKEVFSLGIISGYIKINPVKMVDLPRMREKSKKEKPFTLDEIDLILSNCSSVNTRNFFGICFFTGMRAGEVLALKWEDIDLDTDTISINKTVAKGVINSPKTASSYRDIEMLPKAKEFLRSQQLQTGIKNSYVFIDRHGSFYPESTTFYTLFQKLLVKCNLNRTRLHNTRHTFASLMLNNGIEPMWVSNTLGHESIEMTLKIYAHYMPKKEKMVIEFLEKRYKSGTHN